MKPNSPVDCWASSAGRRCILTICQWLIGSEFLPVPSKSRYPLGCLLLHLERDANHVLKMLNIYKIGTIFL